MEPLKPLGRALSDAPFKESLAKKLTTPATNVDQPISVFDWFKLAKGTWKFLVRPLWQLVTFPFKFVVIMKGEDTYANRQHAWEEQTKRMNPDLYK